MDHDISNRRSRDAIRELDTHARRRDRISPQDTASPGRTIDSNPVRRKTFAIKPATRDHVLPMTDNEQFVSGILRVDDDSIGEGEIAMLDPAHMREVRQQPVKRHAKVPLAGINGLRSRQQPLPRPFDELSETCGHE